MMTLIPDREGDEEGGRPKEGNKFGKDSARGRDPLGSHDRRKQYGIPSFTL